MSDWIVLSLSWEKASNGEKVVVKFINRYPKLKVIRASLKDLENLYFGYSVVRVGSLEDFFKKLDQKTFVIFTSKKGQHVQKC